MWQTATWRNVEQPLRGITATLLYVLRVQRSVFKAALAGKIIECHGISTQMLQPEFQHFFLPALLQKLVGEFFLLFRREIWKI